MSELFDSLDAPPEQDHDVVISEDEPFVAIPVSIIERHGKVLGCTGMAVYICLKSHANRKQGMRTFVATKTIAKELGCGESTVRRDLAKMSEIGLVEKHLRNGKSTVYYIRQPRYLIADTPLPNSATPLSNSDITIRNNQKNVTTPSLREVTFAIESPESNLHHRIALFIQTLHEKHFGIKCQWDKREAGQLTRLIKANPSWKPEDYERMIRNRFKSEAITPDRPGVWLSNLGRYADGPLDRFGKRPETNHLTSKQRSQINAFNEIFGTGEAGND